MTTSCSPGTVPILMYHAIGRADGPFTRFAIDAGRFAEHMAYLDDAGFRTHTVSDMPLLWRETGRPHRHVLITFDDAFVDFADMAMPILERHGFTATVFVPTHFVGGSATWLHAEGQAFRRVLGWSALRDLIAAGIECGGHSHTHAQLDRLDRSATLIEARTCREQLEANLASEVHSFAYPFGYHDRGARGAVEAAGFRVACAVGDDVSTARDDRLALPRLTVDAGTSVEELARMITTPPRRPRTLVREGKRWAWRLVRGATRRPARSI